jgi:hypothetical protein
MLKRIFICLALILLVGAFYGYTWIKRRSMQIAGQKEVNEYIKQHKTLESFGDIDLDATTLTFGKLQERLQNPSIRLACSRNSSRLGWACKGQECLIFAWFATPVDKTIAANEVPVALMVHDTWGSLFGGPPHVSISEAYLGEPLDQLRKSGKNRGYGLEKGMNKITWDANWSLVFTSAQGKINSLYFLNEPLLQKAAFEEKSIILQNPRNLQNK